VNATTAAAPAKVTSLFVRGTILKTQLTVFSFEVKVSELTRLSTRAYCREQAIWPSEVVMYSNLKYRHVICLP
jgi:hypothetical protein